MTTVTRDGWSVSLTTGDGIEGARLSVAKHYGSGTFRADGVRSLSGGAAFADGSGFRYGEGNGRLFPDREAAWAWALKRGYLQPYRRRS